MGKDQQIVPHCQAEQYLNDIKQQMYLEVVHSTVCLCFVLYSAVMLQGLKILQQIHKLFGFTPEYDLYIKRYLCAAVDNYIFIIYIPYILIFKSLHTICMDKFSVNSLLRYIHHDGKYKENLNFLDLCICFLDIGYDHVYECIRSHSFISGQLN